LVFTHHSGSYPKLTSVFTLPDVNDNGGKYKNAIKQPLNSVNVDISELPQVSSAGVWFKLRAIAVILGWKTKKFRKLKDFASDRRSLRDKQREKSFPRKFKSQKLSLWKRGKSIGILFKMNCSRYSVGGGVEAVEGNFAWVPKQHWWSIIFEFRPEKALNFSTERARLLVGTKSFLSVSFN
jgi:hypothetical protein